MDAETEVSELNFKIQDSAFLTFHFQDSTDNNMNLMKCLKKLQEISEYHPEPLLALCQKNYEEKLLLQIRKKYERK